MEYVEELEHLISRSVTFYLSSCLCAEGSCFLGNSPTKNVSKMQSRHKRGMQVSFEGQWLQATLLLLTGAGGVEAAPLLHRNLSRVCNHLA